MTRRLEATLPGSVNDRGGTAPASPSVAAVVVTFNRGETMARTLAAILGQTRPPDEVYVVDNGVGAERIARQAGEAVRYVRMPENLGYAAGLAEGMRRGWERAHDYLWLLDDDSTPAETALERCLALAVTRPRLGIVGLSGGSMRRGVPDHHAVPAPTSALPGALDAFACDFVLVDGALVSRHAVTDVGYPRADFFMMMEDVEYTGRIGRAGWEVVVLGGDLIARHHLGSGGGGTAAPPWRGYYQTRNHLLVALEHRSPDEVLGWLLRQSKFVLGALVTRDRPWQRLRLRTLGAWHGLRGVTGRTIEPTSYP